jgi:hypothetical protein
LTGNAYKWDIDLMKSQCDMNVVCEYLLAFYAGDDEAANVILKTSMTILNFMVDNIIFSYRCRKTGVQGQRDPENPSWTGMSLTYYY